MSTGSDLISLIASRQNLDDYQKKHWSGSFAEYLDIVRHDPNVTRTAYQSLYDMITSKGTEDIIVNKEKLLRYKFFEDPDNSGEDAISPPKPRCSLNNSQECLSRGARKLPFEGMKSTSW